MKKFQVYGTAHMACVITVEAESSREAIDIANNCPAANWDLTTTQVQGPVEAECAELAR